MEPELKTIIFFGRTPEELYKSIAYICECIKERKDAAHKLYISPLMNHIYLLSMGCVDTDGVKHIIGNHEIIFMPDKQEEMDRLKQNKKVIFSKNCMCFVGDSEKKLQKTQDIIDWVLEIKEEIKL